VFEGPNQLRSIILGPSLCAALLGAMSLQGRQLSKLPDPEPFHRRAAEAINGIPLVIPPWMGREGEAEALRPEERSLLKPNAYRCITFVDTRAAALSDASRRVVLMVDQCKLASDMSGHFPPKCYPSRGYLQPEGEGRERDWQIAGMHIPGMEYQFERRDAGRIIKTTVYNFMVLPNKGIQRDMKAVDASAEDYQQRYYGAAQFQVVFGGSLAESTSASRQARDAVFAELIAPCSSVIRTLSDGVTE
jgi:hypothetical protein